MIDFGNALAALQGSYQSAAPRPRPRPRRPGGAGLSGLLGSRLLGGEGYHALPPGPSPEPRPAHPLDHAPMPGPGYPSHPDHAPMPGPGPIDSLSPHGPGPIGRGVSPLVGALRPHFQRPRRPQYNRGMGTQNPFAGHMFGGQQF